MPQKNIEIDITGAVDLPGPLHIAATVHYPEARNLRMPPLAIFASPGGGYTRGYFDLRFDGHADYSQAEHHIDRGLILIAYDHLGVGDSSIPDLSAITIEMLAAANDAMVRKVSAALEDGSPTPDLPPLKGLKRIGIGQSMGGCVTIVMQGRHASFDAIASLGYSAIHTVPPLKDEHKRQGLMEATGVLNRQTDVRTLSIAERTSSHTDNDLSWCHHWEDVEPAIRKADTPDGYAFRRYDNWPPYWRSATLPPCALIMMSPGCVAEEAAAITVPVLTAMGERDVCPRPHEEPAAYVKSRDVSMHIVPRMAHMHNFASTRRQMWDRLTDWADQQVN